MRAPETFLHALSASAAVSLAVGLVLHASTYFGADPRESSRGLWYGLQLSSAVAFIPALLFFNRRGPADAHAPKTRYEKALAVGFLIFLVYAFCNFFYAGAVLNEGASPVVVDGQYVLLRHGAVIRVLGRGEFVKHRVYEARQNSGHWMLLYDTVLVAIRQFSRRRSTPAAGS